MTRNIHMAPGRLTRLQAKAGIIVASFFLLFGLLFGAVVLPEMSAAEIGLALLVGGFFLLWVVVCLAMIVAFARMLWAHRTPQENSLADFYVGEPDTGNSAPLSGDFAERLRKLEALKRDGLISEDEYRGKRRQILDEKW